MNDHIDFLESLILSSNLIDKKYRDGVTNLVSMMDVNDHSDDPTAAKSKKRRSSKKPKPGKNGLYQFEDELVRRWWTAHDDDNEGAGLEMSRDDQAKKRISQLRLRETQLQMILILEVLALQPLATALGTTGEALPGVISPIGKVPEKKDKPVVLKKQSQLDTLIGIHIDRLCIWQSIALESIRPANGDSQNEGPRQQSHSDNVLRDFCVEVIVPL